MRTASRWLLIFVLGALILAACVQPEATPTPAPTPTPTPTSLPISTATPTSVVPLKPTSTPPQISPGPLTLPPAPEAAPLLLKAKTFELSLDRTNYTAIRPLTQNAEVWVTVKNTSGQADTIIFSTKTDTLRGWMVHGNRQVYLEAGESDRVKLLIAESTEEARDEEAGRITVHVTASSHSIPDSTQSFSLGITTSQLNWRDLAKDIAIRGHVYDKETGKPITGATVVSKLWSRDTEQQSMTDSEGYFQIPVPSYDWLDRELFQKFALHGSAEYVVAVHAPGYSSSYATELKPRPKSPLSLDFALEKLKVSAVFDLSWERGLEYPGVWKTAVSDDWNRIAVAMGKHPDPGDKPVATNVYAFNSAGDRLWSYPIGEEAWGLDITHDGSKVAVGSNDRNVYVFDSEGGLLWKYYSYINREVRFSHSGVYLAFGPTKPGAEWFGLFDASTGEMLWERPVSDWVRFVAFSEDDTLIAVGGGNQLFLFDIDGTLRWRRHIAGIPFYIGISSDLSRIFVVDKGQLVSAFDEEGNLLWSHTIEVPTAGAMSRDGSKMVALNINGAVFTFDRDGNLLWHRVFEGAGHNALQMSKDGKYIVLGGGTERYPLWTALLTSEGTLLWEDQIPVTAPRGIHPYRVSTMHVAMSEDYTYILSGYGSYRPAIRLYKGSIQSTRE